MVLLNTDTFDGTCLPDRNHLDGLLNMMVKSGHRRILVPAKDYDLVRRACKSCYAKAADSVLHAHFEPLRGLRFMGQYVTQSARTGQLALPADILAHASRTSGMSVGLSDSKYGDDFIYEVESLAGCSTEVFKSMMPVCHQHLSRPDYKRWHDLELFEQDLSFQSLQLPLDVYKHFGQQTAAPVPYEKWRRQDWVEKTQPRFRSARNKYDGNATFRPGFKQLGVGYRRLVCDVLREAYAHQLYTMVQQNAFSLETDEYVGAADGHPTKSLILYVTNPNVVHVRPYENRGAFVSHLKLHFD